MLPGSSGNTAAMSSACCPGRAIPRDPRAGWRRAGPARGGRCAGGRIPGSQRRDRDRRAAAGGGPERRRCVADHGDDTLRADEARRAPPAAAPARSRAQRSGRRDAPRRALEAPGRSAAPGRLCRQIPARPGGHHGGAAQRRAGLVRVARRDAAGPTAHRRAHAPAATTSRRIRAPAGCDLAPLDRTRRRAGRIRNGGGASVHADPAAGAGPGPAPRPLPLWAFTPKGALAKVYGIQDRREPLAPEVLARAADLPGRARQALRLAAAAGPLLRRPALRDYIVPLAQRAASKSLRTLVRGSRLPLPDTRFIRLFLWWKNGRARTDIDLSAASSTPISCSCRRSRTTT